VYNQIESGILCIGTPIKHRMERINMKAITKEVRTGKVTGKQLFTTYQCILLERIGDTSKEHNYNEYDNYNVGVLINRGLVKRTLTPNGDIFLTLSRKGIEALAEYTKQKAITEKLTQTIRQVTLEANSLHNLYLIANNRYTQMCDNIEGYTGDERKAQYEKMLNTKEKYEEFIGQLVKVIQ
jgi:hypothetical protein